MVTMTLKEQLTEATRTIDALREQLGHEHTLSVELEALLNGKDAFISEQADRLAFHVRESARLQEQFLAHIARDEDTIRYWTAEWERQRDQIAELKNDLTESAAQNTAQNHRIAELEIELNARRTWGNEHEGGCQNPHGGKCTCGWNMVEAAFAERDGEQERAEWLRSTVKFAYDEDRERTDEILAALRSSSETKESSR
jgi:hypothetical protein